VLALRHGFAHYDFAAAIDPEPLVGLDHPMLD
jgi:hypothetical protein